MAPSAEFMSRNGTPFSPSPRPGAGPHMRSLSAYGSISGSRGASPFGAPMPGHGRGQSLYHDEDVMGTMGISSSATFAYGSEEPAAGARDELPPPFTVGNFNDPLFEKLSDAARQHEELYRTAATPLPSSPVPHRNYSNDTYTSTSALHHPSPTLTSGSSQQELYNPYLNTYTSDSENEEELKPTSPILNRTSTSSHTGVRHSMAGDIGWAV